jgi:hypothetical protein
MKFKNIVVLLMPLFLFIGCNFSPLSPSNRPRINNNGDIGDIKNNQNGIMAEILSLKNRLEIMAEEVENIQNGLINNNNKNFGVQIFQGEGGLIVGFSLVVILSLVAVNYKLKSEKYKKTAELFGKEIKRLNNIDVENKLFANALANKIEKNVYDILKK